MILLIDNYDSFVYNLARYLAEMGCETKVVRNDQLTVDAIRDLSPQVIIFSPGPCTPNEAGISIDVVRMLGKQIPMLGVCLGHQTIAAAYGASIVRAPEPIHGRTSQIRHDGRGVFAGLPDPLTATRYHSLVVDPETLPDELDVTAQSDDGVVMAIAHREFPLFGVQFHPESVLTRSGHALLASFLSIAGIPVRSYPPGDHVGAGAEIGWFDAPPLVR